MKISYNSQEEKQAIIDDQTAKGLYLISDNGTLDGNYLEFSGMKPIPIEDQLAEKDRQVVEIKKNQSVTDTTVSEISTTLQELIEYTMEMGNM